MADGDKFREEPAMPPIFWEGGRETIPGKQPSHDFMVIVIPSVAKEACLNPLPLETLIYSD